MLYNFDHTLITSIHQFITNFDNSIGIYYVFVQCDIHCIHPMVKVHFFVIFVLIVILKRTLIKCAKAKLERKPAKSFN